MARDNYAALAADLRQLLGAANVTTGEGSRTICVRPAPPMGDARPEEIAGVLRLAGRYGVGVSITGDLSGGINLRLDRWNRVLAVDREKLCLTVQPQAETRRILDGLAEEGLCLPPDPCLKAAICADKEEVIRGYAATRRVLGVEAVLPDGRPVRLGGPMGGDQLELGLARLILGAGGALGVVTGLYLQLGCQAPASAFLMAGFAHVEEARAAFFDLYAYPEMAGVCLECLDFNLLVDGPACDHLLPYAACGGMLILEFAGSSHDVVEEAYARAGALCRETGAREVLAADNPAARQRVKKIREYYLSSVRHGRPLSHVSGPVRKQWLELAQAGGLTVPYCRLEGGTLCLGLAGPAEALPRFMTGLRPAAGWDEAVPAVLAGIGRALDPGAVLAAAGGIIEG